MRLLAVGDVCGSIGCDEIRRVLPALKRDKKIDMTVINGENSADGNGILPESAQSLFACGADVITGGNHSLRRKQIFDYLDGDSCVFEKVALTRLADDGQLMSYIHEGFWQCMDNIREKSLLEKLLSEDKAPWKRWERSIPNIPDFAK